jgi:AmmeMemoRadiSam system protein A
MEKLKLSLEEKTTLFKTVRLTIEEKLFGKISVPMPSLAAPVFSQNYGLFVTLTMDKNLRGCIGYVEGIKPLREAVKEMAIQAAFHDPRFNPLQKEELDKIHIEISILYPLEEVKDFSRIKVGRDGLVMERGFNRGLLLPQVAAEYEWDNIEFMNQTCRKAGMEKECWNNGARVLKFEAEVFGENEQ